MSKQVTGRYKVERTTIRTSHASVTLMGELPPTGKSRLPHEIRFSIPARDALDFTPGRFMMLTLEADTDKQPNPSAERLWKEYHLNQIRGNAEGIKQLEAMLAAAKKTQAQLVAEHGDPTGALPDPDEEVTPGGESGFGALLFKVAEGAESSGDRMPDAPDVPSPGDPPTPPTG